MSSVYSEYIMKLLENADEKYAVFMSKLIPNSGEIIGVRAPCMQALAKDLAKGQWREYFAHNEDRYYEETLLQGLTIGYLHEDIRTVLSEVENFLPKINNWAVCDSFCAGLKITKKNKKEMWNFINEKIKSTNPYYIRFSVVMLLDYYIDTEYLNEIFLLFDSVKHDDYYVKMAVAWAVSMCYIKLSEQTMPYLLENSLDDFTYNKALQKICESRKIDDTDKSKIRQMKRRTIKL